MTQTTNDARGRLTPRERLALSLLDDGPRSAREVAEAMKISSTYAHALLNGLEGKGLARAGPAKPTGRGNCTAVMWHSYATEAG